jgi:hypothetical protein
MDYDAFCRHMDAEQAILYISRRRIHVHHAPSKEEVDENFMNRASSWSRKLSNLVGVSMEIVIIIVSSEGRFQIRPWSNRCSILFSFSSNSLS